MCYMCKGLLVLFIFSQMYGESIVIHDRTKIDLECSLEMSKVLGHVNIEKVFRNIVIMTVARSIV